MSAENDWAGFPARDIFIAVRDKKFARLKEVLKTKRDRVNDLDSGDDGRWGVLHYLCAKPSYEAAYIDLLVEHGADVNLRNHTQETPLMLAVIYENVRAAECLLKHGARPECSDWCGRTALARAKQKRGRLKETFVQMIENSLTKPAGSRQSKAEELRQKGNEAWRQGNIQKALDLYTKSLSAYEDHRTLTNRAACWLRMREWDKAARDATRAAAVQPTFEKAWLRLLKSYHGLRNFPLMRLHADRALQHCPHSAQLSRVFSILGQLAVPEHWSNPLSLQYDAALAAIRAGQDSSTCPYCLHAIPLPLPAMCPRCTCDPRNAVDEALVAELDRLCEVGATPLAPSPLSAAASAEQAAALAAVRQAALGGDCAAIRSLHASRAALAAPDEEGFHATLHAVRAGQAEAVRLLVELGGVQLLAQASAPPSAGVLPAHLAAGNGDERMLDLLLELGGAETLARPEQAGS
eukprot:3494627-Rhodomonas_salina.4